MKLTRYRPLLFDRMFWPRVGAAPDAFSRVFDELLSPVVPAEGIGWFPAVDVVDSDEELLLIAELPGLKKEEVDIDVADGVLTLKGEKREEKEEKKQHYRVLERTYGAFERSFTLPRSVDASKITADFENGVLKVHMPKTELTQGRRVEIAG